jgi:hypothetical protein
VKPREALAARSDKDVRYGAMRRAAISNTVPVPISPELVLVDPELRRKVLSQLLEDLLLDALPEPGPLSSQVELAPRPIEPPAPEPLARPVAPKPLAEVLQRPGQAAPKRRKRRLVPALLPVSVALNVILIALSVSDARVAQTTPSPPRANGPTAPNQVTPTTPATEPRATKTQQRARTTGPAATERVRKAKRRALQRAARARELRGRVEQKVLNTVIQSPAGKLPRALIDSRTGLAKNNLQAVCRSSGGGGFLCVVQPAQHRPGEGLYAAYKPGKNGKGTFAWYSYRSGT